MRLAARFAAVLLLATGASGALVGGVTATGHAQERCLGPGEAVRPVPWAQTLLKPSRAWSLTTGAGQRVAVVSTGVSGTSLLDGAVDQRADLAPAVRSGEPSGQVDCVGLGTGVAGLIAAPPVDGVGFHGIAPDARILDAKVVGDRFPADQQSAGWVPPDLLAEGIDWAVEQEATVIVVPTGAYRDDQALRRAVAAALVAGIVVVAAVGEPGPNELAELVPYPAGYEGVIGVGAIGPDGTVRESRPGQVDLVAPGWDLVTTYPQDGLGAAGGTALAAGYVAGSAALVRAYRPELSPAEVAHRLFATAAPAPEGVGSPSYGYGIVNPYQAVVERVVTGQPAAQAPFVPAAVSAEEQARLAAEARSEAAAERAAAFGLVVALVAVVGIGLGARARRRGWRVGTSAVPKERPEDEILGPPMELFGEPPRSSVDQK